MFLKKKLNNTISVKLMTKSTSYDFGVKYVCNKNVSLSQGHDKHWTFADHIYSEKKIGILRY